MDECKALTDGPYTSFISAIENDINTLLKVGRLTPKTPLIHSYYPPHYP